MWRLLYFIFIILMIIALVDEFLDTKAEPTEQGIISTLTLALMITFKIFLYWFTTGIESSMDLAFSTNSNNQIAQIEAANSELSYQEDGGEWAVALPLTPLSGRVIITELEGRESRTSWEPRAGRASQGSRVGWGSQPGISGIPLTGNRNAAGESRLGWGSQPGLRLASSGEGGDSHSGWGSQSAVSDSRTDGESFRSASGLDSQSQSVRTSREAVSTISSISGWTTASGRESRSDMK